ncbi:MAG: hypothetical protein A2X77_05385 [Gammaproteobacteria bacterium GWE2_42_36]|nr:MAG: hypothetical protein A2X77_05385 [Gammaproteobacteria bacterium GWE2_42_36]HCU05116.1 hypothetical protein [Coxiellaceae bacterium]
MLEIAKALRYIGHVCLGCTSIAVVEQQIGGQYKKDAATTQQNEQFLSDSKSRNDQLARISSDASHLSESSPYRDLDLTFARNAIGCPNPLPGPLEGKFQGALTASQHALASLDAYARIKQGFMCPAVPPTATDTTSLAVFLGTMMPLALLRRLIPMDYFAALFTACTLGCYTTSSALETIHILRNQEEYMTADGTLLDHTSTTSRFWILSTLFIGLRDTKKIDSITEISPIRKMAVVDRLLLTWFFGSTIGTLFSNPSPSIQSTCPPLSDTCAQIEAGGESAFSQLNAAGVGTTQPICLDKLAALPSIYDSTTAAVNSALQLGQCTISTITRLDPVTTIGRSIVGIPSAGISSLSPIPSATWQLVSDTVSNPLSPLLTLLLARWMQSGRAKQIRDTPQGIISAAIEEGLVQRAQKENDSVVALLLTHQQTGAVLSTARAAQKKHPSHQQNYLSLNGSASEPPASTVEALTDLNNLVVPKR